MQKENKSEKGLIDSVEQKPLEKKGLTLSEVMGMNRAERRRIGKFHGQKFYGTMKPFVNKDKVKK